METGIRRLSLHTTNRPVSVIKFWHDSNELVLDASYQRGDVWGELRQQMLIKSILLGIPIPAIIINDRASSGWGEASCVVIDGKQRVTAILKFLKGQLLVPGEWFGLSGHISHNDLSVIQQRKFSNFTLGFVEGRLPSLEDEEEVFKLVNFAGVPQGESDLC